MTAEAAWQANMNSCERCRFYVSKTVHRSIGVVSVDCGAMCLAP